MSRRVVVTGIGLITPLGTGTNKTWSAVCAGKSGIGEITKFDTTGFMSQIAGEVNDFIPEDFLKKKDIKRLQPFTAYGIAATRIALEDSNFIIDSSNENRVGVITGCGMGGLGAIEKTSLLINTAGPRKVSPFFIPTIIGNMASGMISIYFGSKGPNSSIATACAAGSHAIGSAYEIIKNGSADAMITGGVESVISPCGVAGFNALKALSTRNDEPEKASRPFDKDRDGFIIAEGGGILLLESLEGALERDAHIYAEIIGYGMSGDGYHMTAPAPNGEGAVRCMQAAIDSAGILPDEIDYINAHGTSTKMNDIYETMAIKTVFKEKAYAIPVSSTKSMTGHMLGASGGVETIFTALSIRDGIIPPTINFDNPDEQCDLDYVPNIARKADIKIAMTNSFGFGGTNASLILQKY